jgi:hypothetical protein
MNVPADNTNATGIQVTTKIFPLAFLLLFFKTNVTIDGVTSVQPWGSHFFSVPPGMHDVAVSFRYIFSQAMGESRIAAEVHAGQATHVRYRSPFLIFMRGSIKVEAPSTNP